jgi:hypothetical protein
VAVDLPDVLEAAPPFDLADAAPPEPAAEALPRLRWSTTTYPPARWSTTSYSRLRWSAPAYPRLTWSLPMAVEGDIEVFRGCPWYQEFEYPEGADDISLWTIVLTVRNKWMPYGAAVLAKTAGIVNGPGRVFSLSATAADLLITPGEYVFDIQRTDSGAENVLRFGEFRVKRVARQ